MKKEVFTDLAPKAVGPYSQAIWAGNTLYCSGQIPIDPKTNEVVAGDVEVQTKQVMENIKALLSSQDLSLDSIVKTTIYLSDMGHFQKMNAIYESYLSKPYPARSTVAVKTLPKNVDVEIEVLVVK
ncbi:MAG: RidA family protein [Bdellovibrionales bacterium]|nr:RidA family protein [Bdellovibrionales bacterium]